MAEWKTVDSAPEGRWLVTCHEDEGGLNLCMRFDGGWADQSGRDTIANGGSFRAPTHWLEVRPVSEPVVFEGRWTPFEISVMLHHFKSSAPHPKRDVPAYAPAVARLAKLGLMEGERLTFLGELLIYAICATPTPRLIDSGP